MVKTDTPEPDSPIPRFPTQNGGTLPPSIAASILTVSSARDFGQIAMGLWAFLIWVLVVTVIFRVILGRTVYYFRRRGFFEDGLGVALACNGLGSTITLTVVSYGDLFPFTLSLIPKALFGSVTSGSPILMGVTIFLTVAFPYVLTALIIGLFQKRGGKN